MSCNYRSNASARHALVSCSPGTHVALRLRATCCTDARIYGANTLARTSVHIYTRGYLLDGREAHAPMSRQSTCDTFTASMLLMRRAAFCFEFEALIFFVSANFIGIRIYSSDTQDHLVGKHRVRRVENLLIKYTETKMHPSAREIVIKKRGLQHTHIGFAST